MRNEEDSKQSQWRDPTEAKFLETGTAPFDFLLLVY
jgi:hypothetical protein